MNSALNNIVDMSYPFLPYTLQNLICSTYGLLENRKRFGKEFRQNLDFLEKTQWWSKEEVEKYQLKKTNDILSYVNKYVPYYKLNDSYPQFLNTLTGISDLPVLNKEEIRTNESNFLSSEFSRDQLSKFSTSGTTGKPLTFYRTSSSISYQWAVWSRHKQRFGVNFDDYHALFTGKPIVPAGQSKPPYWRINKPMNQLVFGMQHTRPNTIGSIIDKLSKETILFYTGYPSIMYQIAITALDKGLSVTDGPKVIFTGAEPIYDFQRVAIEACFGAYVTDQYGTSEGVANASKCMEGNYHIDFEFGYMEVIPDGLSHDPEVGEILMTGFTNLGMPLIRYAIGDRGKLSNDKCLCGRQSPILSKLEGRSEDYVLTPEGNRITRFDYIFKGIKGLEEAQIIQHTEGEIDILVVVHNTFDNTEQAKIRANIHRYISPTLKAEIKQAESIPRTRNGKFRAVVNKLA